MNLYQMITDRVLQSLKIGVVPWRKTWASGLPKSLVTGREYRGINIVALALSPYSSRYWLTFRETTRLGGCIRKGEKGTKIVFWHWRDEEEVRSLKDKTGKSVSPC